jgi:zinc transport system permease protein
MIASALQYEFFRHALIAGLLASVACGVIGSFVVVKRMTSISGGLSHAAFGGLGLGYLLGFSPMLGATIFCLIGAVIIGVVSQRQRESLDTLISMVWSIGMALGVLFIAMAPGPVPDLNSYLFGSILFVPLEYLLLVAVLDLVIVGCVLLCFKELRAISFDEEFAEVVGVPAEGYFLLLLALTALGIVTLIRVVGVIMLIALLTIPAVIARQWSGSLKKMIYLATLISALCTTFGLFLSWWFSFSLNIQAPTGPLVILLAVLLFGLSCGARFLARAK